MVVQSPTSPPTCVGRNLWQELQEERRVLRAEIAADQAEKEQSRLQVLRDDLACAMTAACPSRETQSGIMAGVFPSCFIDSHIGGAVFVSPSIALRSLFDPPSRELFFWLIL